MKTYIIEDKLINLKTKEVKTFYTGKDGYVHEFPEYADGYTRPNYAQSKIEKEMDNIIIQKLDENHGLENNTWLHIYSVIEYVKGE